MKAAISRVSGIESNEANSRRRVGADEMIAMLKQSFGRLVDVEDRVISNFLGA